MDGLQLWDGHLEGLGKADLLSIAVRTLDLVLPNGERRQAILPHASGTYLRGTGPTPFE